MEYRVREAKDGVNIEINDMQLIMLILNEIDYADFEDIAKRKAV